MEWKQKMRQYPSYSEVEIVDVKMNEKVILVLYKVVKIERDY